MAGFAETIVIDRPPREVFAFATDPDNFGKWFPQVLKFEQLTEGPVGVGTQFRETRLMGKKEATAVIEVSEHEGPPAKKEPPFVHAASSSMMAIQATYRYVFAEEQPGKTRVDLEATVVATKFLAKLMVGMVNRAMQREDAAQLERLKAAIEGE